jgi:hypothetical protein
VRDLAVVAVGLVAGLGFAFGPRILDDAGAEKAAAQPTGAAPLASLSTQQVANASVSAAKTLAAEPTVPDPPAAAAPSAGAAVEALLNAEVANRYDVSYGLLSAADRVRVGGRTPWVADHADIPQVTGFVVDAVSEEGDEATITTSTDLHASLDRIIGLVPAHARATWVAVREDGGWRVAYGRSRLEPQYPSDALAAAAAREWVAARQECRRVAEWSGGLIGPVAIATRLCRATGPVTVGAAAALSDDSGSAELTAAFGPDVSSWARVVPVTEPARLDVIVAPVGERWLVIGVRTASPDAK